jgi:hypothetical protein
MFPTPEQFVEAWQESSCITEVSVRLTKLGYPSMTPKLCLLWATAMKQMGVRLKRIPRPEIPAVPVEALKTPEKVDMALLDIDVGAPVPVEALKTPEKFETLVMRNPSDGLLDKRLKDALLTDYLQKIHDGELNVEALCVSHHGQDWARHIRD